jgi:hypothetical protein
VRRTSITCHVTAAQTQWLSRQSCNDRVDVGATNQLLPSIAWIVLEGDCTSCFEFYHLLFDDLAAIPCRLHNLAYRLALRHHLVWHLLASFDQPSAREGIALLLCKYVRRAFLVQVNANCNTGLLDSAALC